MKVVADNSGSGATTSTRIQDSGRNPQIIPGQQSACRKLNAFLGYRRLLTSDRPLESYPTEKNILPVLGWRSCYTILNSEERFGPSVAVFTRFRSQNLEENHHSQKKLLLRKRANQSQPDAGLRFLEIDPHTPCLNSKLGQECFDSIQGPFASARVHDGPFPRTIPLRLDLSVLVPLCVSLQAHLRQRWERFTPVLNRWIPPPRVLHSYPDARFYATHPS